MPRYDYLCASNGQVVEVTHALGQPLATWGELCERLGLEPGTTPASAPVERLMSAPNMVLGKASGGPSAAPAVAAPAHQCGGGCHHH
jgi:predicted nucleic acid-binding Zn ribbon protein